jgi:hypothetical protein
MRLPEPPLDQVQLGSRRRYAALGLLLKGVQHVNNSGESHGIGGAVGLPRALGPTEIKAQIGSALDA